MKRSKMCGIGKILGVALIGSLMMTGCGSSDKASNGGYYAAATESYYDTSTDYVMEKGESFTGNVTATQVTEANQASQTSTRKLIRTVDLQVETKTFNDVVNSVNTKVNELGGYVESMNTYNGSSYSNYRQTRTSDMVLRIPKDKADEFLDMVSGASNVVSRSENMKDVTLSYVDMKSHKEALQTEYDRLLVLLENAEILEDIITLENRLSDVRYQIESMESQLRSYDDKVDYTTISLTIKEVEELTPVVMEEESFLQRISEGFKENLDDVIDGFVEFAIWFISSLPKLVIWAVVIAVVVIIVKKIRKKRKMKKAAAIKGFKQSDSVVLQSPAETTEQKLEQDKKL